VVVATLPDAVVVAAVSALAVMAFTSCGFSRVTPCPVLVASVAPVSAFAVVALVLTPVTACAVCAVTPVSPAVFVELTLLTTFANVGDTPVIHSAAETRRGMATMMAVALELAKNTWSVVLLSRPMALSPATVRFAVFELAFI